MLCLSPNARSSSEAGRQPKKNLPLALIGSICGVALLYVLFNWSIYRVLPYDTIVQMVSGRNFYLGTAAANTLFGSAGLLIVGSAMVLAIFNSLNGCVMVFPRLYYAMARDGALFRQLAYLHPVYKTPVYAQIASAVMAVILICSRSLSELTSLVAVDGIIRAVGSEEEVAAQAPAGTVVWDAAGRTVVPGFNDSHQHLLNTGIALTSIRLN